METSMDFFSDSIFPEFDRSDFIGGIDNEALDFGALDQYMSATAAVGLDDDGGSGSNGDNTCVNNANETKIKLSNSSPNIVGNESVKHVLPIATISTRVIATPLTNTSSNGQHITHAAHSHLPESPPDSGSEPPYSPLQDMHGLTLTSRDLYNGLTRDLSTQFTPPPPQVSQQQHQHHHQQQQQQTHYTNLLTTQQQQQQESQSTVEAINEIRVKHEAANMNMHQVSLIANEIPQQQQQQMMFQQPTNTGNHMNHFEQINNTTLYETCVSYSNTLNSEHEEPPHTCMLTTSTSNGTRVQIVGTTQAPITSTPRSSAPSTPVNSASRKRKMSTQIDSNDIAMQLSATISPSLKKAMVHEPHTIASPALSSINIDNSMDGGNSNAANSTNSENGDSNNSGALSPCIRFTAFQPQNWHKLVDQNLQDLSPIYYRVDADKGFNFSISDDAFVCQKKNHFQITCHARLQGDAKFVKTAAGLEKIKAFHLHFYGVKLETPNQTIRVEQSQSDRSKKPFFPVPIDLQSHVVSKITVGRLHFSETTNNNMRKKGRPNPEQRYFQLVVGLHVHTLSGNFPIASQGSERIIVRASNPGQFESDVDLCWQRGLTQDSICHSGRVGINTDRPDESLVVHGNLKVSGHIVQPSDSRAKHEIGELDTSVQLRNLLKIRIVKYRYERDFAIHSGLKRNSDSDNEEIVDTGVIAQEVREVIPDAVQTAGSIVLPNGNVIENFLLVNKDRILMENIGAVKELSKMTGCLETRIEHLERVNDSLVEANKYASNNLTNKKSSPFATNLDTAEAGYEICSNRSLQLIIFILVIVMAACLAAVSTLYFMEHNRQMNNYKHMENMQVLGNDAEHLMHWPNLTYLRSTPRTISARNKTQTHIHDAPPFSYNENNSGGEMSGIMEKPLLYHHQSVKEQNYKISTSAPNHPNNKTLHIGKTKSKWPLPHEILRIAAQQQFHYVTPANIGTKFTTAVQDVEPVEAINSSKATSSEKSSAADTIPLSGDFENNSIDIDAQQHGTKNPTQTGKVIIPIVSASQSLNDAVVVHETSLEQNEDADVAPKLSEPPRSSVEVTSSVNSGQLSVPDTTAPAHSHRLSSGDVVIYSVYKAVSPPTSTLALTTNKLVAEAAHTNYSMEVSPPTNNNSRNGDRALDTADALDLQNLSSNNDSVDNPITAVFGFEYKATNGRESNLGRRSAQLQQQNASERVVRVEELGMPASCLKAMAHCASACYVEQNELNLSSPEKRNLNTQQDVDSENVDSDDEDANEEIINNNNATTTTTTTTIGKSSHNTVALAKQLNVSEQLEQQQQQADIDVDANEGNLEQSDDPHVIEDEGTEAYTNIDAVASSACFTISSIIVSTQFHNRLAQPEQICENNDKTLNITYIIPVSQYFHQTNIELHLSSAQPLYWILCSQHEQLQPTVKHLSAHALLTRTNNNTNILLINIPTRGAFHYDIQLRSTLKQKMDENICQSISHKGNTLLQYNFSILRNCD